MSTGGRVIEHDRAKHRFVVQIDADTARLDYEVDGAAMRITHTHVPPRWRGQGVAAELMQAALAFATQLHWTVVPVCSYAVAYMRRESDAQERHQEALLDEALEESFPASDPPAVGGVS